MEIWKNIPAYYPLSFFKTMFSNKLFDSALSWKQMICPDKRTISG